MSEKIVSKYVTDPIRERTRIYEESEVRSDGRVRRDKMKEEEGLCCRGKCGMPSVGTRSALRLGERMKRRQSLRAHRKGEKDGRKGNLHSRDISRIIIYMHNRL